MNEEELMAELDRIVTGTYVAEDNARNHKAFAVSHKLLQEKLNMLMDLLTEEDEDEDDA